jgi:prepilin-type N-terminal cleavage/methylation domain-containing protein
MLAAMKPRRGISFAELLVVLAVLAIVLAAAAPWLADLINRRRTLATAEALMTDLAYARSESGLRVQQVLVDFNADGDTSCYTLHYPFEGGNCNCLRGLGNACQTITGRALPEIELRTVVVSSHQGVDIRIVPGSWPPGTAEYRIAFIAPQLSVYPPAGRVNVTGRSGLRLQLQLDAMGRTSLCARAGPAHGVPACP